MNEKTNVATGSILYRVNYNFVRDAALKNGVLVVEAADSKTAQDSAEKRIKALGHSNYRITNCKPY